MVHMEDSTGPADGGTAAQRFTAEGLRRRAVSIALLAGVCVWSAAQPVFAQALPEPVRVAMKKSGVPTDSFTLLAAPLARDAPPRVRLGAERPVNPASVMKLVTTYAALDTLGPEFAWQTQFLVDGVVSAGLLRGNLYVRGGGDPKFVMERIAAALQAVRESGISVVHGDIVLDHGVFQVTRNDPAAFDGERLRPYNVAPEGLLVNFKSVILKFEPDSAAQMARVVHEPPLAGVAVDAAVPLVPGPCADWRGGLQARFERPDAIRFSGKYPVSCGVREWPVAYIDPDTFAARAMEGMWRTAGGLLTGQARAGTTPADARVVHTAASLPLSDIVADINKFSNNVMAQQVFLTLGRVTPGSGAAKGATLSGVGTFERSRAWLDRWWRSRMGPSIPQPFVENGSGLSREERITADALLALLRDAAVHPVAGPVLLQSLAVAGVDGTAIRMGERGLMKAALGNARVKTGSLRDVASVAGYVQAQDGATWGVVGIVNHPQAAQARPVLDALLEWVANQPR